MNLLSLNWHDHRFDLLAERGVYWRTGRALIVADVHFGKADHFRQAGVPVPWGTAEANLARLDAMLDATAAERLIVLGDLFHARTGLSRPLLDCLQHWRKQRNTLAITVVPGNHDAELADTAGELDMQWVDPVWREGGVAFCHDPAVKVDDVAVMAGHLHPAVRLHGAGRASMRLPCFWFGRQTAVLPAFGAFTGMHPIRPRVGDRVVAVHPAGEGLVEVAGRGG